jgi:hypothetical protein
VKRRGGQRRILRIGKEECFREGEMEEKERAVD